MMPNQGQIWSALRTLLSVGFGMLIGRGLINEETATALVGAIMTLAPLAWGMWNQTQASKIAAVASLSHEAKAEVAAVLPADIKVAAVAALPDVRQVVINSNVARDSVAEIAADRTQPKVTSG